MKKLLEYVQTIGTVARALEPLAKRYERRQFAAEIFYRRLFYYGDRIDFAGHAAESVKAADALLAALDKERAS